MAAPGGAEPLLNTDNAKRSIWIVKVPEFVAAKWRKVCEQSMNVDLGEKGPKLATLTRPAATAANPDRKFELRLDGEATAGVPQEYAVRVDAKPAAMLAFSDNKGRLAAEGAVQYRLEVEPGARAGGGAAAGAPGLRIDPGYAALSRERHLAADAKTRTVQLMTDPMITNIRRPVGALAPTRRRGGEGPEKRTAMAAEELQAALFRLFERQRWWAFGQLQRQTGQPTEHLKRVLGEIAAQNKTGPYNTMWELKKEFRTQREAPAAGEPKQES